MSNQGDCSYSNHHVLQKYGFQEMTEYMMQLSCKLELFLLEKETKTQEAKNYEDQEVQKDYTAI